MNHLNEPNLLFTEKSIAQLKKISESKGTELALRIRVISGGCAGFQYALSLESPYPLDASSQDVWVTREGVSVVTDTLSLSYIQGSTIDYQESLMMNQFVIFNPNSDENCSCGSSFQMKS